MKFSINVYLTGFGVEATVLEIQRLEDSVKRESDFFVPFLILRITYFLLLLGEKC